MTPFEVPRTDLVESLRARARGAPFVITGPPGIGKTWLLAALSERLQAEGTLAVRLDLMGAASSPDRFVAAVLRALPAAPLARHLKAATRAKALAEGGRENAGAAVRAVFDLLAGLDEGGGKGVVLLLDEVTEIRSLAYFKGLREVHEPFAAALSARSGGTVLATSFPTLSARLWPPFEALPIPPLTAGEIEPWRARCGARVKDSEIAKATAGFPRYALVLAERLARAGDVAEAWTEEMAPGGRLDEACRHVYETLLLRSRGYGMAKAALAEVAREPGQNLTALVARLGRTPGATRDYLQWLVDVDALRRVRKRYFFVDPLVGAWVRLHAQGTPPRAADVRAAAAPFLELASPAGPEPALTAAETAPSARGSRRDSLMEID
jgi:hypothetical protein